MRAEELLERYAAGERDFSGIEIIASDELIGANLTGINLSRSILAEMILERVDFSDANLRNTNFGQTDLRSANLQRADLSGVNLGHATLDGANLTDAHSIGAYIDIDMIGVIFTRTDLTDAEIGNEPCFSNCIFSDTIMPDGNIAIDDSFEIGDSSYFVGCIFNNTFLSDTDIDIDDT